MAVFFGFAIATDALEILSIWKKQILLGETESQ